MNKKIDFYKVKGTTLGNIQDTKVDVFVCIEDKYVKVISRDSSFIKTEIEHYLKKNIEYFYLDQQDYLRVINKLNELGEAKERQINKALEVSAETYSFIKTRLTRCGFSASDYELMHKSTEAFLKEMNKAPNNLRDKLSEFLNRKDYIVNQSLMTLYLTTNIARKLSWHNDATYQKIQLASLFKDIALDNPYFAKIRRLTDQNYEVLSLEEKTMVKNHPEEALKLIAPLELFSSDVESLIRDHHELPDRSGFARGIGGDKLSPLTCAFIICGYFSQEFLTTEIEIQESDKILKSMKELFDTSNFRQCYKALVEIVGEKA